MLTQSIFRLKINKNPIFRLKQLIVPNLRLDRLSALVARFAIDVTPDSNHNANLVIYNSTDSFAAGRIVFSPANNLLPAEIATEDALFLAHALWGGSNNPLLSALPQRIEMSLDGDLELQSLATLLISENNDKRCGYASVVNRLGEVLLVRLIRAQLSAGTTNVGILGGLADTRLSSVIVAMHEHPGQQWDVEQLAEVAGLSTSRFADRFSSIVGRTPMSYLRQWRMVLARQDVERGDRIQSVATRYGYASSEALTRAFKRQFGCNPMQVRNSSPC